MNATKELGDVLIMSFKFINSVDNGDIERPLLRPRAEFLGLDILLLFLLGNSGNTVDRKEVADDAGLLFPIKYGPKSHIPLLLIEAR